MSEDKKYAIVIDGKLHKCTKKQFELLTGIRQVTDEDMLSRVFKKVEKKTFMDKYVVSCISIQTRPKGLCSVCGHTPSKDYPNTWNKCCDGTEYCRVCGNKIKEMKS